MHIHSKVVCASQFIQLPKGQYAASGEWKAIVDKSNSGVVAGRYIILEDDIKYLFTTILLYVFSSEPAMFAPDRCLDKTPTLLRSAMRSTATRLKVRTKYPLHP